MTSVNYNEIRISRRDYFALPSEMRCMAKRPMVLTTIRGQQMFVPAIIIN